MKQARRSHGIVALVAAGILGCGSAAAGRPDREADRRALTELEEQWLHADDAATLDRILAADFVHVIPSAVFLSKQQHIDWFRLHPPPASQKLRFEKLTIRLYGQVGIVNGIVAAGDRSATALERTAFTDVFVYREGRWQAVNGQENRIETRPH
jgi:hypothetical protein